MDRIILPLLELLELLLVLLLASVAVDIITGYLLGP